MPNTAIAFPRISREVIEEMSAESDGVDTSRFERFYKEQPVLFDWLINGHQDAELAVQRMASMAFIYEALQIQMRRAA